MVALGKPKALSRNLSSQYGYLREYQSVQRLVRGKVVETQNHFLRDLHRFEQATGMNPDQFLAYAEAHKSVEVVDLIDKIADSLRPGAKVNFRANLRSFLRHNGYNNLPKANLTYILQDWHRAYRKEEIKSLLSYLDNDFHKLYVYMAVESGLRAQTVIDVTYEHIKDDLEAGLEEAAIRFKPEAYSRKKAAGFSFLGKRSLNLIRKMIADGRIKTKAYTKTWKTTNKKTGEVTSREIPVKGLIPFSYTAIYLALDVARKKAGLDLRIQPNHGLRKYFENALDKADIDHEPKMVLEGHFASSRAKSYSSREWDELRPVYRKAYAFIDPEQSNVEMAVKVQSQEDEVKDLRKELASLSAQLAAIRREMQKKK